MQNILSKGDRLVKPRTISLPLRREVYDWLASIAAPNSCSVTRVARAIIEDAFDHRDLASDQEVTDDVV